MQALHELFLNGFKYHQDIYNGHHFANSFKSQVNLELNRELKVYIIYDIEYPLNNLSHAFAFEYCICTILNKNINKEKFSLRISSNIFVRGISVKSEDLYSKEIMCID